MSATADTRLLTTTAAIFDCVKFHNLSKSSRELLCSGKILPNTWQLSAQLREYSKTPERTSAYRAVAGLITGGFLAPWRWRVGGAGNCRESNAIREYIMPSAVGDKVYPIVTIELPSWFTGRERWASVLMLYINDPKKYRNAKAITKLLGIKHDTASEFLREMASVGVLTASWRCIGRSKSGPNYEKVYQLARTFVKKTFSSVTAAAKKVRDFAVSVAEDLKWQKAATTAARARVKIGTVGEVVVDLISKAMGAAKITSPNIWTKTKMRKYYLENDLENLNGDDKYRWALSRAFTYRMHLTGGREYLNQRVADEVIQFCKESELTAKQLSNILASVCSTKYPMRWWLNNIDAADQHYQRGGAAETVYVEYHLKERPSEIKRKVAKASEPIEYGSYNFPNTTEGVKDYTLYMLNNAKRLGKPIELVGVFVSQRFGRPMTSDEIAFMHRMGLDHNLPVKSYDTRGVLTPPVEVVEPVLVATGTKEEHEAYIIEMIGNATQLGRPIRDIIPFFEREFNGPMSPEEIKFMESNS